MTFGEKLKQIRIEKGMAQQEFAVLLNTSKQVISRYELGQTTPKIGVAAKMCQILGVNLDNMINDDKDIYDSSLIHKCKPTYIVDVEKFQLTIHEEKVIIAYRNKPEMQPAVDKLLGIDAEESTEIIKIAARNGSFTETTITNGDIKKINNLPDVDDI